jgi:hypothetical protein
VVLTAQLGLLVNIKGLSMSTIPTRDSSLTKENPIDPTSQPDLLT